MSKRLLIISAAVVMMGFFTACGKYSKNEKQPVKWNFTQSAKQEEGRSTKYTDTEITNSAKKYGDDSSSNTGYDSAAVIDDLIKTIKDAGEYVNSLEDVTEEDLTVTNPQ